MAKKGFYSQLFKRFINKNESDYTAIVKAELLFRIRELEKKNCSCFQCQSDLEKFENYLEKMNDSNEKLQSNHGGTDPN